MKTRLAVAAAAFALVTGAVTGCAGTADPAETTPLFSNEDEAFAAAEATYRAYVDALNGRRADPGSEVDPEAFLSGDALEVDIDTQQQLDQSGLTITGTTVIKSLVAESVSEDLSEIVVAVCLDSSQTRVQDDAGDDVTPVDRETVTPVSVTMAPSGQDLVITHSEASTGTAC